MTSALPQATTRGHASLWRRDVAAEFSDYLRDESRRAGSAGAIAFPHDEDETAACLMEAAVGCGVTVQGARTGITGGAVPDGGLILNLSRMQGILDVQLGASAGEYRLTVQPGLPLKALREALARRLPDGVARPGAGTAAALRALQSGPPVWFPPDPTETSASLGGMLACNASGACSYAYGPTRRYVEALRVVLADGRRLALRRGIERAVGRSFALLTGDGQLCAGQLPDYRMPGVKNASGYFVADDMDLVDLLIGSEGTLGIITEIELRLLPHPAAMWGLQTFLPSEAAALKFVERLRAGMTRPVAIEFFDQAALDMLRQRKASTPAFKDIPEPPAAGAAVYLEFHGDNEDEVSARVADAAGVLVRSGGREEEAWLASTPAELERLKSFRHAVPEAVNLTIDERRRATPGLTKLGTDMAVPDARIEEVVALYRAGLAKSGLESVVFGHIGNNHLHVNILPRSMAEYETGKALYLEWARNVIGWGGTVSAEHGIGKAKIALLRAMYGDTAITQMRAVKSVFDPAGRLNRGNLF
ncbi:MAG: FAD-binding oxidoreductase [bacterium]